LTGNAECASIVLKKSKVEKWLKRSAMSRRAARKDAKRERQKQQRQKNAVIMNSKPYKITMIVLLALIALLIILIAMDSFGFSL